MAAITRQQLKSSFYSHTRIALAIVEDCCILIVLLLYFHPQIFRRHWTNFSEIATRRGMFWNWLCRMVFIRAPKTLRGENLNFLQFAIPQSTLWASPFHNAREIEKSKTMGQSVARIRREYQTWWVSHHPRLRSVVPLGMRCDCYVGHWPIF